MPDFIRDEVRSNYNIKINSNTPPIPSFSEMGLPEALVQFIEL